MPFLFTSLSLFAYLYLFCISLEIPEPIVSIYNTRFFFFSSLIVIFSLNGWFYSFSETPIFRLIYTFIDREDRIGSGLGSGFGKKFGRLVDGFFFYDLDDLYDLDVFRFILTILSLLLRVFLS